VDLRILRDVGGEDLLCQRRVPVRHLKRLCSDEFVLVRLVKHLVQALVLFETLAVPLRAAEHEDVADLRQHVQDPLPPAHAGGADGRAAEVAASTITAMPASARATSAPRFLWNIVRVLPFVSDELPRPERDSMSGWCKACRAAREHATRDRPPVDRVERDADR